MCFMGNYNMMSGLLWPQCSICLSVKSQMVLHTYVYIVYNMYYNDMIYKTPEI